MLRVYGSGVRITLQAKLRLWNLGFKEYGSELMGMLTTMRESYEH